MAPLGKKSSKIMEVQIYRIGNDTKYIWNTIGIHSPRRSMTVNLDEYELNRLIVRDLGP